MMGESSRRCLDSGAWGGVEPACIANGKNDNLYETPCLPYILNSSFVVLKFQAVMDKSKLLCTKGNSSCSLLVYKSL